MGFKKFMKDGSKSITTEYTKSLIGNLERTIDLYYNRDPNNVKDNQSELNGFSLSPNPASDFIEISVGANGRSPLQSDVRIFNVFGQAMSTPVCFADTPASGGQVRIDVSGLAPGMYFVRIGNKVSKFIKL
jgi:hypothetical protein